MALALDLAHGTQTASIGTEHTLSTQTGSGIFTIVVNLKNLADGDRVVLRAYAKVLTGDSQAWLVYEGTYDHKQGDGSAVGSSALGEVLAASPPVVSPFSVSFTLKQTVGTGRAFDWRVDQLN
ncbi:MAG: hypothetical protein ACM35H_14210 [Bacteroidota bacterium]